MRPEAPFERYFQPRASLSVRSLARLFIPLLACLVLRLPAAPAPSFGPSPNHPVALTRWTLRDGLPDHGILSLVPAPDGYLWIGTRSGLARFDGYRFYTLTPETTAGLASDAIRSLAVDRQGQLWCATKKGVIRVRSGTATLFQTSDGLAGDVTSTLRASARGGIWVAGDHGVSRILDNTVSAYTNLPPPNTTAFGLEEMPDGSLMVGLQTGVFTLDPATRTYREVWKTPPVPGDADPPMARHLCHDGTNRLWIGGNFGLFRWEHGQARRTTAADGDELAPVTSLSRDPSNRLWVSTPHRVFHTRQSQDDLRPAFEIPDHAGVRCVAAGSRDSVWIGSERGGLFRASHVPASVIDIEAGLIHPEVHSITPRSSGGVWVATEKGMHAIVGSRPILSLPASPAGPLSLRTIAELPDGSVLVGSTQEGVFRGDPNHRQWTPLPTWSANRQCNAIYTETNGLIWIGSKGGLSRIAPSSSLSPNANADTFPPHAVDIVTYRQGSTTLSAGTETWMIRSNVWHRRQGDYDVPGNREAAQTALGEALVGLALPQGLPFQDVRVILRGANQDLWLGVANKGLYTLRGDRILPAPGSGALVDASVWALFEDPDERLWIGTDTGLRMLYRGQLRSFSDHAELPSGPVWQILGTPSDDLWLLTHQGLVCVKRSDLVRPPSSLHDPIQRLNLSDLDGMPSAQISGESQPAGCVAADGTLWVPTRQGIIVVDPNLVAQPDAPPSVHIESVDTGQALPRAAPATLRWTGVREETVSDLPWRSPRREPPESSWPPSVTLPADGGRSILIRYSSTAFTDPLRSRFRFRLVGHDPRWIEAGAERQAHYSNLRPGHYRFEVIGGNRWNLWNREGAALDIRVEARFTESPAFALSCVVIGFAAVTLYLRQYLRQLRERQDRKDAQREAEFRLRLSQDLHDDFGSGLARILMLAGTARQTRPANPDLEGIFEKIEQVAHETSRTLSRFIWAVNARNDTVRGLVTYSARYAEDILRPANIALRLDLPQTLPDTPLRSEKRNEIFLTIKECLNNVAKHSAATQVHFRLIPDPQAIHLEIHDNGRGLPHPMRMALRDLASGSNHAPLSGRPGLGGNGLANMFARMHRVGGQLEINSRQDAGTLVKLRVPYDQVRSHHRG